MARDYVSGYGKTLSGIELFIKTVMLAIWSKEKKMIQQLIQNLQHDISILQYYIENRKAAGFHDMERLVEVISKKILNITEGYSLRNVNLLKMNFPAIDLEDLGAGVVVQVTTNASPSKIKKTIDKFENLGLDKKYSTLYIMGFCKSSKVKGLRANYSVIEDRKSVV
jgi:hypothetical protein